MQTFAAYAINKEATRKAVTMVIIARFLRENGLDASADQVFNELVDTYGWGRVNSQIISNPNYRA